MNYSDEKKYNYYFRIRKGEVEFEFKTDDLEQFDLKVKNWVENICSEVLVPKDPDNIEAKELVLRRKDFIEMKDLCKINDFCEKQSNNTFISNSDLEFEDLLEESKNEPKTEIIELEDDKSNQNNLGFKELVRLKRPNNKTKWILCAAYWIEEIEKHKSFTIKQLNAKIVPLGNEAIVHKDIDKALSDGIIEKFEYSESSESKSLNSFMHYKISLEGKRVYSNDFG